MSFVRATRLQRIVGAIFRRCLSILVVVFSQSLRTLQSTAHASKNRGSALRAASRVARAMLPRKTLKIDPKVDPKSSKISGFRRIWRYVGVGIDRFGLLGGRAALDSPVSGPRRPSGAKVGAFLVGLGAKHFSRLLDDPKSPAQTFV